MFLDITIEANYDNGNNKMENIEDPIQVQNEFLTKKDFDADVGHDHIELKVVEPKQEQLDSSNTPQNGINENQVSEVSPNSSNNDLEGKYHLDL